MKVPMVWKSIAYGRSTLMKVCYRWLAERCYCSRNVLQLGDRGLISDVIPEKCTNEVLDLLNKAPQTVYAGFDPTADSLHVGNLLVLLNLLHWQRGGHQAIILLGGATACIGDPSGKSKERNMLYKAEVEMNCKVIEESLREIICNHENLYGQKLTNRLKPIKIVNNADWYENMNVLDLIGKIGRHFRVGSMLGRHAVRERMDSGSGISFTEFSYQILQAYDWLQLYEKYNCRFQVGGSDQHGNIISGLELIAKMQKTSVFGMTIPLVTNEEGDKFGKTAGNAVWLSRTKTTPFQLYQFFIRTKDSDIQKLLMLYTFEKISRILEIMNEHWKKPEKRMAQKILARHITQLVHGEEGLKHAELVTSALYNRSSEVLKNLEPADICSVFEGATLIELLLKPGTTILDASVQAGCFKTEADALRIISAGGFYINQQRVDNFQEVVTPTSHIMPNNITLMRVGKKSYTIVKWLQ